MRVFFPKTLLFPPYFHILVIAVNRYPTSAFSAVSEVLTEQSHNTREQLDRLAYDQDAWRVLVCGYAGVKGIDGGDDEPVHTMWFDCVMHDSCVVLSPRVPVCWRQFAG